MASFGLGSLQRLQTCDDRLIKLFNEVVKTWDCQVLQGKRTADEEAQHIADGTSHTNHSKHVYPVDVPSLAVDVAPYPVDWKDIRRFYAFGGYVLGVASQMGIKIRWGGDWNSNRIFTDQNFNDLPHFEIDDAQIIPAPVTVA